MLDLTRLPEAELSAFVARQPWFRAHRSEGAAMRVVEATYVHTVAPLLAIALVEVATERGLNEIYQLPIGLRPEGEASACARRSRRSTAGRRTTRSPIPSSPARSSTSCATPARCDSDVSTIDFLPVGGPRRRPGAGLGRAAGDRRGSPQHVGRDRRGAGAEGLPAAHRGRQPGGRAAALPRRARLREHARAARLLRALRSPDRLDARHRHPLRAGRARRLVVRALVAGGRFRARVRARVARRRSRALPGGARAARRGHRLDARRCSPPTRAIPSFAAEEPSAESLALVAATLDEEIEAVFAHLPESEVLAPIAGRGEEVRERLRVLASMTSRSRVIRIHGNLHLGDLLWTGVGLARARLRGPARAQRRRSAGASARRCATSRACCARSPTPRRRRCWRAATRRPRAGRRRRARTSCAATSRSPGASGFVPGGAAGAEQLLEIFELEKAVDELRHELEVRPDWVSIPVAAIERLLAEPLAE